jgi:hypothetical protein
MVSLHVPVPLDVAKQMTQGTPMRRDYSNLKMMQAFFHLSFTFLSPFLVALLQYFTEAAPSRGGRHSVS